MDFVAPNEGWIVGYRFLLHLRDGHLTRTFVDPHDVAWLMTVDFLSSDDGWAGGFRMVESERAEGIIWHYQKGEWVPVDLSPLGLDDWVVDTIRFASPRQGWALGSVGERPSGSIVLSYDGTTWTVVAHPDTVGRQWNLIDMCVDASGNGWAVGSIGARHESKPLVVAVRGDTWQAAEIPTSGIDSGNLYEVVCLPDGKAMVGGYRGKFLEGRAILFAYDGAWKRIELSEELDSLEITALAALSLDDFWLSLSKPGARSLLMHFRHGAWVEVPRPLVPHGGLQGYGIKEIQFISPDEAWAIAHDGDGPGLFRGLVLHYKDGVWRNRNWNWHFWDERWFGLFGR
jgi:hypothetical protein